MLRSIWVVFMLDNRDITCAGVSSRPSVFRLSTATAVFVAMARRVVSRRRAASAYCPFFK
jgi:hypothetical protein